MTMTSIDSYHLRGCLLAASAAIQAREGYLNDLDSAIGDGDHGITMRIGFDAVCRALSSLDEESGPEKLLREAGKAFMGATGGAIGPLLGGMLISAGQSLSGHSLIELRELKILLTAMQTSISRMGKAKPGDKTILDAVDSTCQALTYFESPDIVQAIQRASKAAAEGAESTANMLCVKGRASRLGERVLGHPDPGAVSFSIILAAFADYLTAVETQN